MRAGSAAPEQEIPEREGPFHISVSAEGDGRKAMRTSEHTRRRALRELFSSKQEVDACGVPKMVFVGIVSSHEPR